MGMISAKLRPTIHVKLSVKGVDANDAFEAGARRVTGDDDDNDNVFAPRVGFPAHAQSLGSCVVGEQQLFRFSFGVIGRRRSNVVWRNGAVFDFLQQRSITAVATPVVLVKNTEGRSMRH